jgi:type IV secretory pathway VirD2 relaxase
MRDDDPFKVRLAKPKSRGGETGRSAVQDVLRAIARAGGKVRAGPARKSAFTGRCIGRGSGVARVLTERTTGLQARRVIVKARIARVGPKGLKAAKLHLRYVQRDGVTREGEPGELYDKDLDRADGKAFIERADGDRHQFRFIVAAEDGVEYEDLKPLTRRLMTRMEDDLDTKLDWVAVDHFNTGHPHTHIIVRGKDDKGKDLIIAREYITHGMRERASEIVTLDLGPRSQLEIEQRLTQETTQDRLTSIDRRLIQDMDDGGIVQAGAADRFHQSLRAGRLQHLKQLGLADEIEPGRWRLSEDLEGTLRRMGERDDIIKTMSRAMTRERIERAPVDLAIYDPANARGPLVGRLIERGLNDEAGACHYLIIDGVDGRSHWVDIGSADDAMESVPVGAVLAVRPRRTGPRASDRTIAEIAAQNEGQYSPAFHMISDPAANAQFIAAHVRRLEALRRLGIGERQQDGVWRVPENYLEVVVALSHRLAKDAPVAVDVLSPVPVGRQVLADAATWLDRALIGDDASAVRDAGFGREVKGALAQRRQWLIEQQLAEERQGQIIYRGSLLVLLQRRELSRAAAQLSGNLGLPYAEFDGSRVEGKYLRRVDLVSGRFAVIERARDFTLVPWRPVLERNLGKVVAGLARGATISWEIGRSRSGPTIE